MKRRIILLIVLVLAFTLPTHALATTEQAAKNAGTFTLVGKITTLDAVAKTVTVEVAHGNRQVRAYVGQSLLVTTTTTTRFLVNDGATTAVIAFIDLKVGDFVSVQGKLFDGIWRANRVTVDLKAPCR